MKSVNIKPVKVPPTSMKPVGVSTIKVPSILTQDEEAKDIEFEKLSTREIRERNRRDKFWKTQYEKINKITELAGEFPLDKERITLLTQKQFNAFAIVLYILSHKQKIKELYLTTFRIDTFSVEGIENMIKDGTVEKVTVVVSKFFNETKKLNKAGQMMKEVARRNKNVRLLFCNNHTKIIAAEISDNEKYIVEGSGNLTANGKIELYSFERNTDGFRFHKEWIDELCDNAEKYSDVILIG